MIDDVRRRVQQEQAGHRGRRRDPLYGIRKLLLKACDNLDGPGWARMSAGLAPGDSDGAVSAAWQLKEITRDVGHAREALDLLYAWADSGDVPEIRRFACTIARWSPRCWPTSPPAAPPTDLLKPSTC